MKISLLYIQVIEGNNVAPPLGMMYIAAVARDAGHKVQFLDIDPDEIDVVKKVQDFAPDLIGLGFLTTEFEKARILSHRLKAALPDTLLCCGGVHTTTDTENVLRKFNVDFCVVGEGEETFIEVCKRIEAGQSYEDILGICFLKDTQLIRNPRRELIKDLDSIPFPARELVDFSNIYITFPGVMRGKYIRSTIVIPSRGCNFRCSFCAIDKIFPRWRLRSPDNILEEVVYLQKTYDVKGIAFYDGTFTANKEWLMSFCKKVIYRDMKFHWVCGTRVDSVDTEILQAMKEAGCKQIDFGIESGSPKILKILNKRISPEKAISAVRMTQDVGIRIGVTFMVGSPDEEISDIEMTFGLAKKLNADYTVFFFTIPYPGTKLWEIAKERNLLKNINYDNQWNIRIAEFPFICENIPKDKLQFYRAKLQNHFFIRNYLKFDNIIGGLQLLRIMFRYPSVIRKGIKKVLKSKRIDSLIEEILVAYRKSLYKYY